MLYFLSKSKKNAAFFFQGKPEKGRLNKVIFYFQLHFVTKFVLAPKVFLQTSSFGHISAPR
jgi:hypothetical protein